MNYIVHINNRQWIICAGTLCQAIQMAQAIKEEQE